MPMLLTNVCRAFIHAFSVRHARTPVDRAHSQQQSHARFMRGGSGTLTLPFDLLHRLPAIPGLDRHCPPFNNSGNDKVRVTKMTELAQ